MPAETSSRLMFPRDGFTTFRRLCTQTTQRRCIDPIEFIFYN
jgi:hypothetical protein